MANKVIENKGMVEIIEIEVDGVKFVQTRPGYYYKRQDGKQTRISKADWEQAFDQYMANKQDEEPVEQEQPKQAKPRKARKSKDIAFEMDGVTLTAKQVKFIKLMPRDDFFENGLESSLWIDVFCDTVADEFNSMAVGAMVSTLREKNLIYVVSDKINDRKCKWMAFTELGKQVAKELGLA